VAIHPDRREVVVGSADDLAGHTVHLDELNWLDEALEPGDRCEVQIRYRARSAAATILERQDASLDLALETPVRAIAPGQSGVLYSSGGRVLGGGVIG